MSNSMKQLAEVLATRAEAICKHLLPNGRRAGDYWWVGNVYGDKGKSLHIALTGAKAGQWVDEATGDFGDLINLIAQNRNLSLGDAAHYARATYLGGTTPPPAQATDNTQEADKRRERRQWAARQIWEGAKPITDTLAAQYLTLRGIVPRVIANASALRFDANCLYYEGERKEPHPAMIAVIRDARGDLQGIHRTYLAEPGIKAYVETPRRALGRIERGHIGFVHNPQNPHLVIAEGIENALTVKTLFPATNVVSCVSAGHLARFIPPAWARRIAIAPDIDRAGMQGGIQLRDRIRDGGGRAEFVYPLGKGDWNDALVTEPIETLRADFKRQATSLRLDG